VEIIVISSTYSTADPFGIISLHGPEDLNKLWVIFLGFPKYLQLGFSYKYVML
jgi:hypothetical protein